MNSLWRQAYRRWQQWHSAWLRRRVPPQKQQYLSHRTIFIVPSRAGLGFLLLVLLLWLLGTNYQNNLVLAIAFLLLGILLVCVVYTYANLSGLLIQVLRTEPGFVGDFGHVVLLLRCDNQRHYEAIRCYWDKCHVVTASLLACRACQLRVAVPLTRRGCLPLPRLRIETLFPLGILYAWSSLDLDVSLLAYPRPIGSSLSTSLALTDADEAATATAHSVGTDVFAGLRDYQPGDAFNRVAWFSLARGQGLATKHYEHPVEESLYLDWAAFPGLGTEERLSRLCGALQALSARETGDYRYGLRLPGIEIPPGQGVCHRRQILQALALFEAAGDGR
ncbi:MAG: DUF58 domain-containing protein [Cellvibrionaceae bacterium]|nr:DUF58 domain-containing protein [Cellvibrionaceae bacterium]